MAKKENKSSAVESVSSTVEIMAYIDVTGHVAQQEDHETSKLQAIRSNPINFVWYVFGLWSLIVISFNSQVGRLVISIPEFHKDL